MLKLTEKQFEIYKNYLKEAKIGLNKHINSLYEVSVDALVKECYDNFYDDLNRELLEIKNYKDNEIDELNDGLDETFYYDIQNSIYFGVEMEGNNYEKDINKFI